jgi:hypothetical protein
VFSVRNVQRENGIRTSGATSMRVSPLSSAATVSPSTSDRYGMFANSPVTEPYTGPPKSRMGATPALIRGVLPYTKDRCSSLNDSVRSYAMPAL